MPSVVEICNQALGHLKIAPGISALTERSEEAFACNQFYAQVRDRVLRDFAWPFATVIESLALVEEQPNTEWAYSYQYPAGCMAFRRILSGFRVDTRETAVPYRLGRSPSGILIFTDRPSAEGEYTVQVDDPTQYAPDFVDALSFLLAAYIAPKVTGGDPTGLADKARQMYGWAIAAAQANAANEEQPDAPPEGELYQARN